MKTKRTIRKLTGREKALITYGRALDTQMANVIYNLSQHPGIEKDTRAMMAELCSERDAHRNEIRPLIERLCK